MKTGLIVDLGMMEYGAATVFQGRVVAARKANAVPDILLTCQHPHVITLGRNGKLANLRASESALRQRGVTFFETNRGGDITYHGPGQLVGYPILNLAEIKRDVAWYVRTLEEAMMLAAGEYGVSSKRVAGRTGIWVDSVTAPPSGNSPVPADEEKLAAIGVHLSRWVSSHGFAFNVSTDLRYFDLIVPCGITDKRATSLEKLLGRSVELSEISRRITSHLGELLGIAFCRESFDGLDAMLCEYEGQLVITTT